MYTFFCSHCTKGIYFQPHIWQSNIFWKSMVFLDAAMIKMDSLNELIHVVIEEKGPLLEFTGRKQYISLIGRKKILELKICLLYANLEAVLGPMTGCYSEKYWNWIEEEFN